MANPRKSSTVVTEAVGDGLGVFDPEQRKSYVLNATSALVFEHCDGETSPRQLTELLCRKFNVPAAQAEELLRLALDELERAHLLEADVVPPPVAAFSRRAALTALATTGLSLLLVPMVTSLAAADGGGNDDHHGGDDDDDHGEHKLIPLLECVDHNSNGTFTAHFGYLNQTHKAITVPLGNKNEFDPGQPDRGQPTVFLPGEHLNVFSVIFDGDAIHWILQAKGDRRHQVTASSGSEACPTTTTTTTSTTPAPFTTTTPAPFTTTTPAPSTTLTF